ncbi:hypothetical protein CONLIGDRAFT_681472 [Coniochaeta ligniaria NRRL 30616]|uniref:DNA replication checkpoint mediator MRC1 domain-containing protein n=1 Tax=Coniochaeta ligniaria NRRL 30616 TaxID=1408157 RepID=A0A1J7IM23_9PEZI|nr:hypothetical protein CONLIGDRAFT_681472 [Coniochaeta ligniaria NRRL 30616]
MASSPPRSSSPAGSTSSPPGTPLTPRSKIKALLAPLESSSDEESGPASKKPVTTASHPVTKPASRPASSASSTASSDDEDAILRPRGKLAARMLAQVNGRQSSPSKTGNDARERVRKMLQAEAKPRESENAMPTSSHNEAEDAEEDDDDEIVAPRPRKLQQRRIRSITPEADGAEPGTAPTPGPRVSRAASRSPGLFVSSPVQPRSPSAHSDARSSDSDPDLPNLKNPRRFKEILARKREERLAREAEEERKRAARLAIQQAEDDIMADDGDDSNVTDDEGGRTLTQKSRPSRKASKKALEEMSRETQRMTRSLQLAHEAKTKKKMTKASLFERFNFKPEGSAVLAPKLSSSSRPVSPVSAHHTDAEMRDVDTPPSSPPAPVKPADDGKVMAPETNVDSVMLGEDGDDLPTLEATFEAAARQKALEKGKGKATAADLEAQARDEQPKPLPTVRRNVRVKLPTIHANVVALGSDDELDIQPSKGKTKIDAILSRGPVNKAKESRPMYMLRRLANLDDPDKKGSAPTGVGKRATKPSMTAAELQASLVQRARAQAKLERDRRLELLKSKGIHIPTEEEREKERAEVEDIVARAREEAEEIMLREREAAKQDRKERKEAGEVDPLAWEDSDASDDDYEDEKEAETKEIELSGSEEEDEEIEDEDEEATGSATGGLIDDAAESSAESDEVEAEDAEQASPSSDDDEAAALPRQASRRPNKQVVILSDDEESDHHVEATPRPKVTFPKSPSAPNTVSPKVPTSVLRSATKTFIPGLPVAGPAGLGLTQIFAGTMDDSQAGPFGASPSQMMPTFDNFPDSQFSQTAQEASADDMILDSQPTQRATQTQAVETQEGVQLHFSQSQMHGFDSLLQQTDDTQQSELLEPTQDGGFQEYTPLKQRFIDPPASTIDTVVLNESQRNELQNDSPLVQRAGKLRRRADVLAATRAAQSEEEDETSAMDGVEFDEFGFGTTSAFTLMKDAAAKEKKSKAKAAFDKKKSKAKEMIDEQADESEDEYAGLGGVDGEDSDDESNASVQEMVDDETKLSEADRAKLKAFYVDRERASDEKQVEKLFKDITTGMLRRKRGADYDLSDSDDGGEAKRRMKRRQFAKMQKALFSDERISKVAENPRTQAFLRTIEDRGSDDEMDFLFAPTQPVPDSQEGSQSQEKDAVPDSQPQVAGLAQRAPAAQRRTRDGRKPTTIGDIRASLSDLLEEPATGSSIVPATDLESSDHSADEADAEDDAPEPDSNKENRNPHPRRTGRAAVVDRISLKRNSSSNISTDSTTSRNGRLAFAAPASSAGGFKVPALLRRATTNSLLSGGSSATSSTVGATAPATGGGFGEEGKIKRNAGKKSGINYFARENERRAAVAESEKRREARKWKGAEGRGKVVGSLFGGGKFE